MLKGSKTKILKGRKNRRGLTHVKATFLHTNKQEILIYFDNKEIHAKRLLFLIVLYVLSIVLTY